jgi:hypothetical protein
MDDQAAGGTVLVGRGTYSVKGTLRVRASLSAEPGAELLAGSSGQPILVCDDLTPEGATVEGLTLRSTGPSAPSALCRVSTRRPLTLSGCSFLGVGGEGGGVDASDAADLTVTSCRFSGLTTCVLLLGPTLRIRLSANIIEGWSGRGIYVVSDAAGVSVGLTIEDNTIRDHRGGAGPEQPISLQATDSLLHRDVTLTGNVLLGPSRSWLAPVKGTADQISLTHVDGFVLSGNTSVLGGDMGITVSDQCRNGVVTGNVCVANDAAGIDVGSRTTQWIESVVVRGNYCLNNGRNATGRRQPLERAGLVIVQGGSRTTIEDNAVGNATTLPTYQGYGICAPMGFALDLSSNRFGRHLEGDIGYGMGTPQRAPARLPQVREQDRASLTARLDDVVRDLRSRSLLAA